MAGASGRGGPNILRPLTHIAFLATWQDTLAYFSPAPAIVIANLAVKERWAWFVNLAIAGGAVLFVGVTGIYHLTLSLTGTEPPLPPAILLVTGVVAVPVLFSRARRVIARVLPLDPESPIAILALVAAILIVGVQANYQASHDALAAVNSPAQPQPIAVVVQEIAILPLALLGVGPLPRRPPA